MITKNHPKFDMLTFHLHLLQSEKMGRKKLAFKEKGAVQESSVLFRNSTIRLYLRYNLFL